MPYDPELPKKLRKKEKKLRREAYAINIECGERITNAANSGDMQKAAAAAAFAPISEIRDLRADMHGLTASLIEEMREGRL